MLPGLFVRYFCVLFAVCVLWLRVIDISYMFELKTNYKQTIIYWEIFYIIFFHLLSELFFPCLLGCQWLWYVSNLFVSNCRSYFHFILFLQVTYPFTFISNHSSCYSNENINFSYCCGCIWVALMAFCTWVGCCCWNVYFPVVRLYWYWFLFKL